MQNHSSLNTLVHVHTEVLARGHIQSPRHACHCTNRRTHTAQRSPESCSRPLAASKRLLKFTSMSRPHSATTEIHRSTFAPVHLQIDVLVTTGTSQTAGRHSNLAHRETSSTAGSLPWARQDHVTSESVNLGPRGESGPSTHGRWEPILSSHRVRQVGSDLVQGGWRCHNRCYSPYAQ